MKIVTLWLMADTMEGGPSPLPAGGGDGQLGNVKAPCRTQGGPCDSGGRVPPKRLRVLCILALLEVFNVFFRMFRIFWISNDLGRFLGV